MSWNFDTIFFLAFGCLALYLGLSGSPWLFWGSTSHERLERKMGAGYRKTVNVSCGIISVCLGLYFLLRNT
jgi:sulfite exporter TauE/SafE